MTVDLAGDKWHPYSTRYHFGHAGQGVHVGAACGTTKDALRNLPTQTGGEDLRRPLREIPGLVFDRRPFSASRVLFHGRFHRFDDLNFPIRG